MPPLVTNARRQRTRVSEQESDGVGVIASSHSHPHSLLLASQMARAYGKAAYIEARRKWCVMCYAVEILLRCGQRKRV